MFKKGIIWFLFHVDRGDIAPPPLKVEYSIPLVVPIVELRVQESIMFLYFLICVCRMFFLTWYYKSSGFDFYFCEKEGN